MEKFRDNSLEMSDSKNNHSISVTVYQDADSSFSKANRWMEMKDKNKNKESDSNAFNQTTFLTENQQSILSSPPGI